MMAPLLYLEERFTKTWPAGPVAIAILALSDGRFLDVNDHFVRLVGYESGEIIGRTPTQLGLWSRHEDHLRLVQALREPGSVQGAEARLHTRMGDARDVIISLERIDLDGRPCTLLLLQDVTERKLLELAVHESETRYRLLARAAFDVVWEYDPISDKVIWGEGIHTLFGYSLQEMQPTLSWWLEHIHLQDRARVQLDLERVLAGRVENWVDEYRFLCQDGSYTFVMDRGHIVRDNQGHPLRIIGAMTDIGGHKRVEEALRRQLKELTVLHMVSSAVSEISREDELIARVAGIINQLLYPDHFAIFLVDETAAVLRNSYHYQGEESRALLPLDQGLAGRVATSGAAIRVEDVLLEPAYQPYQPGIRSQLSVPLKVGNRIIGVIDAGSGHPQHFTEDDERLLMTLAGQLATAIDRLRTETTERQRVAQLSAINDIGRTLAETLDLPTIYERLAQAIEQLLPDISTLFISLYDDEQQLITCAYGAHEKEQLDITTLPPIPLEPPGHGPQSETIHSRQPLILNDFPGRLQRTKTVVAIGESERVVQSALFVPMLAKGKAVGVIYVQSYIKNRFSQTDAGLLHLVANTAAIAIENARLFESQRRRRVALEALHRASLHLTSNLALHPVLEAILDYALEMVSADDAHIFLLDEGKLTFGAALWKGAYQHEPFAEPRPGGLSYTVATSGQRVVIPNVNEHPLYADWQWGGAIVGLPLRVGNQVRGVMNVAFVQPHSFDDDELRVLELLADQAAVAMANARLFEETGQRSRELQLLNRVITAASSANSAREVLAIGCAELAAFFAVPQAAVGLLDDGKNHETVVAEYLSPGRPSGLGVCIPVADNPALAAVLDSGQPLAINDVMTHPATEPVRAMLSGRGTISLLIVPIRVRGEVIGTLGIDSLKPRRFTPEEIDLANTVCQELARAIETAQLYDQLRSHAAELEQRVDERTAELGAANERLAQANERLTELDELKSKFVSDVSHELRTPLTNLSLYLYLLERAKPEKRDQYLSTLKEQTVRLSQLIENILDLSRLDSDKYEPEFGPLALNEIVEQVVEVHQPRAQSADLELTFEPGIQLPLVRGDTGQLVRVVTNLIANAINYTPTGYVRLRTYFDRTRQQVCLSVEDSGIGITPEDLPHLFGRFYRGRHASQSDIPGTGLGLAIVKEIVDQHGGSIEVRSSVGKGSAFVVWLPLAGDLPELTPASMQTTLLLVENSRAMREAIRVILEEEGFHILGATHGGEALEQMSAVRPSLILSDVDMPGMDGFAFFKVVRERPDWANIPFIFLTGHPEKQDILASQQLDGVDYLIKPVVAEELVRTIYARLAKSRHSA
jgi:PAS domain S-box-containing protein